ncbi:hypothetical protein HK105_200237 [Polyrhizophydium stewartii]|uniref:Aldehyde dehydrogenase n=1 Tax=Polyrhizophydium stewartii TaxID=2732419 RepID=A0ABR4NKW2_9FUNG|nr:Aldehyde dehydrogenase [Polyrhizophydium stewartii]
MPVPYTPVADIPRLVADARAAYDAGFTKPLAWRRQQLRAIHDFLVKEEKAINEALFKDLHRPEAETMIYDIGMARNAAVHTLEYLDDWVAPERVSGESVAYAMDRLEVRRFPLGVVLIIGTWNYPINLTLIPLITAVAAGNAAVLKLSEVSVNTAELLVRLLPKYVDNSAIKVVYGAVPESTALLEQRFNLIFYTGNAVVARVIMKAAVKHLTPVVLELGGKSPVIVDKDANIPNAVKRIMWAKSMNSGQTCVAPDYVYVHKSVAAQFYAEIPKVAKILYGNDPAKSELYTRIVSDRHFNRLVSTLDAELKVPGVEVVYGGNRDAKERLIEPTVLRGVTQDAKKHPVMKEELFGPIMPVIEYDDVDEVIAAIRAKGEPSLALYPFSSNLKFIEKVVNGVDAGNVIANDLIMSLAVENLPFGGVGESGMGSYHGKHGFDTFSHKRSVMVRPAGLEILNDARYPANGYNRRGFWYKVVEILLFRPMPTDTSIAFSTFWRRNISPLFSPAPILIGLALGFYASIRARAAGLISH